jgi:hypothetical protein
VAKRVLITISRSWRDWNLARAVLGRVYQLAPDAILVSGHCPQGDQDLERIWKGLGGLVEEHPADWASPCDQWCDHGPRIARRGGGTYCPQAGDRRNCEMADLGAALCLAFLGLCVKQRCKWMLPHASHGARSCADYAGHVRGIPVKRFEDPGLLA